MFNPSSAAHSAELRDWLDATGYSAQGLIDHIDTSHPPAPQTRSEAPLLDRTRALGPLDILVRWFLLGLSVPAERAGAVVPDRILAILNDCGLLKADGGRLAAQALIEPFRGKLVASDRFQHIRDPHHADFVLGASRLVDNLVRSHMHDPVDSLLDLCGGGGVLALFAAEHAEQVVTTDLNPRCTDFARLNVWLNGLDNIECVTGDGYTPVAGRRFERILCNPPFIVAPSAELTYRDGGMALDGFVERMLREAPAHLSEGGCLQLVAEWVHQGEGWHERVAPWLEGNGCDNWVFKGYSKDAADYAELRMCELPFKSEAADHAFTDAWMDFYRAQQIEQIHGGFFLLRRRDGANWTRFEEMDDNVEGEYGSGFSKGLAGFDFLDAHADEASLLSARLRRMDGLELVTVHKADDHGWQGARTTLRQTQGLCRSLPVDGGIASFIVGFDGEQSVEQRLAALGAELGAPPEQLAGEVLGVVRRMVELGFLEPVGDLGAWRQCKTSRRKNGTNHVRQPLRHPTRRSQDQGPR